MSQTIGGLSPSSHHPITSLQKSMSDDDDDDDGSNVTKKKISDLYVLSLALAETFLLSHLIPPALPST